MFSISAGWDRTCAITESQAVLCWGYNPSGQLVHGGEEIVSTPTVINVGGTPTVSKFNYFNLYTFTCAQNHLVRICLDFRVDFVDLCHLQLSLPLPYRQDTRIHVSSSTATQ